MAEQPLINPAPQAELVTLARLWPEPLLILDEHGLVVAMSAAAEAATHWQPKQLVGHSAHKILCAETYDQRHDEADCPLRATAGDTKASVYWISAHDSHISVDFRLLPAPVAGHRLLVFRVLGAGEYSRAELKTLAHLCEVTPAPLLEVTAEGMILFANPAMTALMVEYGFDVSGAALILPDDLPQLTKTCVTENRALLDIEKKLRGRSFLWQLFPYPDEGFTNVLVTGSDLTEQHKASQRAKISERQLDVERERMRRNYIAKMVHDLRSPLNAITGFGTLLQRSAASRLDTYENELLDDLQEAARSLADQIKDSLTQARIDAAQMPVNLQLVKLDIVIKSLTRNLAALVQQKGLRLINGTTEMEVTADPQLLAQALTNLVANAIKFTDKGNVTIEAAPVDLNFYRITVSDTGCGITPAAIKTIFEPYSRQPQHEGAVEGQGLGLAIVNDIVKLHGGTISIESTIDEGSRFTLRLPFVP